ncbi:hypothetical protein O181_087100 [Austropuccinia psidii MF-1]|uniref:Uncharacterized protein n=1 Tax=Austropuccinia psidii MF-1 TaxID=1389203 RepID=A0A9Q3P189_9BASI|nr:hypothetical protein [Austropuccinia psidii MF-1]
MEFCNCSVCIKFSIIDENLQQKSGRYISIRNAAKHRVSDRQTSPPKERLSSEEYPQSSGSDNSSINSDKYFDIQKSNPLGLFMVVFISWLHLFCNVSQENWKMAITMIMSVFNLALQHQNPNRNIPIVPRDPQTLIKRANVDIELTKNICCQRCFCLYEFGRDTPLRCGYKEFSNLKSCDEELFVQKGIYKGHKDVGQIEQYLTSMPMTPFSIGTPRCVFVSQRISTWLKWLLSKSDTENVIDTWAGSIHQDQDYGFLSDIQHGENFKQIKWENKPNSLKLALSLFVDWFNPRGNKLSGKIESNGIFAISCLNLPPIICNKLSHMCICGITPGPYSPNTQTLNHLLKPLVDELVKLDSGILIPTYQYPAGQFIQIKLLLVYGDILATKKAVGFASHSATKFCLFCHAQAPELAHLKLAQRRCKDDTLSAAWASKAAISKNA